MPPPTSPAPPSSPPPGRIFRGALAQVLGEWVGDGAWSRTDAQRVAAMLAAGNARRVYRLV